MKKITCVVCPVGCSLTVAQSTDGNVSVTGNRCKRGVDYGVNEWSDPRRVVTSTVRIQGGKESVTSVKTLHPVPKGRILELMDQINQVELPAPCDQGTVVLDKLFGEDNAVVVTRSVEKAS